MNLKDTRQLHSWLASGASLAEVELTPQIGVIGNERFTDQAYRAYKLLWNWSAVRFSGVAGAAQDRYCVRCGYAALQRRIERAQAIIKRLSAPAKQVKRTVLELNAIDLPIKLEQKHAGWDSYTLTYGKQVKTALNHEKASAELGAAIMHALLSKGALS